MPCSTAVDTVSATHHPQATPAATTTKEGGRKIRRWRWQPRSATPRHGNASGWQSCPVIHYARTSSRSTVTERRSPLRWTTSGHWRHIQSLPTTWTISGAYARAVTPAGRLRSAGEAQRDRTGIMTVHRARQRPPRARQGSTSKVWAILSEHRTGSHFATGPKFTKCAFSLVNANYLRY